MEWTVVTALVVIVGLFITVGRPILNQTKEFQRVLDNLEEQQKEVNGHQRILERHEEQLGNHELRIHDIEKEIQK